VASSLSFSRSAVTESSPPTIKKPSPCRINTKSKHQTSRRNKAWEIPNFNKQKRGPAVCALQSSPIDDTNPRCGAAGVAVCVPCAGLPPAVTGRVGGQRGRTWLRCHQHKSNACPVLAPITLRSRSSHVLLSFRLSVIGLLILLS